MDVYVASARGAIAGGLTAMLSVICLVKQAGKMARNWPCFLSKTPVITVISQGVGAKGS